MPGRIAICAIVKQEEPYLLEWVAYHRLLGFELIVLDNGGTDGTSQLLQALDGLGVLRRIDLTWKASQPQLPGYRAALRYARAIGVEFLGFLDIDEFFTREFPLSHLTPDNGAAFLGAEFERLGASQLSYHWLCYGGTETGPAGEGLVLARFEHHAGDAHPDNRFVKSFVRVDDMFDLRTRLLLGPPILSPHHFPATRRWFIDGQRAVATPALASFRTGRVLHYQVKSLVEFTVRRAPRGVSLGPAGKYTPEYFAKHDHRDAVSPAAPEALARLAGEIDELKRRLAAAAGRTSVAAAEARRLSRGLNLRPRIAQRSFRLLSALLAPPDRP